MSYLGINKTQTVLPFSMAKVKLLKQSFGFHLVLINLVVIIYIWTILQPKFRFQKFSTIT